MRSQVWPTIRDAIESDPAPYVMALGIELDSPKKKLRTTAQVFTSKGKGKARENPIGFARPLETRTLCTVGVAHATTPTPAPQAGNKPEITRERESDLDPATYDPETGEFRSVPARTATARAAAKAWVGLALAGSRPKL